MEETKFDAIIVGAGAAGLMAAWELSLTGKSVVVLEATGRIGGRMHTLVDPNIDLPVELGAEFIHGKLHPTLDILKKAGIKKNKVKGSFWQKHAGKLQEQKGFIEDYSALQRKFKKLEHDISVQDFIDQYLQNEKFEELRFTLKNYVEGYYAADTNKASSFSLRDELEEGSEEQYRIEGGYKKMFDYLYQHCVQNKVVFFLSHPVNEIRWSRENSEAVCGQRSFHASKILITVSMGVLQNEKITFIPAISEKITAAKKLGYGPVVKIVLQFTEPFWQHKKYTEEKKLAKLGFLFSKEKIPTWWTYYPNETGMICGWCGGPNAEAIKNLSDEEIAERAIQSLHEIFSIDIETLRAKLKAWHFFNWTKDPFYCGAYSYEVVNGSAAKKILRDPVEDCVYFAGEGLFEGAEIGTVNAALVIGRETAYEMIASFKK